MEAEEGMRESLGKQRQLITDFLNPKRGAGKVVGSDSEPKKVRSDSEKGNRNLKAGSKQRN